MVAERAGVSTAALHYHFDTRENLFAEALHYSFDHTGADVYQAQRHGRHGHRPARPDHLGLAPADAEPPPEWAMWQELWCRAGRDPESRTLAIELYRAHQGWIQETLEDGIASGEFTALRHRGARAAGQLAVRRLRRTADVPAPDPDPRGRPRRRSGRTPTGPLGDRRPISRERAPMTTRASLQSPAAASCSPAPPAAALVASAPGCAYISPPAAQGASTKPVVPEDRRRPRLLQLGRVRRTRRSSRASRRSTASRSSSRTTTRWRACRPSSPPGTATTSSSRRRSGCRS